MFQWWDIFFVGLGWVVLCFALNLLLPPPVGVLCFLLPLCAPLSYPFLSFLLCETLLTECESCTVKDNPGHGEFEVDEINGEGGEGACFV
jgi:hypothetical protein